MLGGTELLDSMGEKGPFICSNISVYSLGLGYLLVKFY